MRISPSFAVAPACLLLLASCVGPATAPARAPVPASATPTRPLPTPTSTPVTAPQPTTPPATGWIDRPVAPGVWTYRPGATGPAALFGPPGAAPRLTVRCDSVGQHILFTRAGQAGSGGGAMTVRTSYGAQAWPARASVGALPEIVATRAASDGGLDQIAYSRGKFAVEVPGLDPLILPAWAEVARVIEDCRG